MSKYKYNFGLFLTSYKNDLYRAKNLAKSFNMYNKDNIPLYIILNDDDMPLFKNEINFNNVYFVKIGRAHV